MIDSIVQLGIFVSILDSVLLKSSSIFLFSVVYYYSARVGVQSIVINPSVCLCDCLFVCLSVHKHISGTAGPFDANFVCSRCPVAMAWSSSSVVLCYVLPVLWMT